MSAVALLQNGTVTFQQLENDVTNIKLDLCDPSLGDGPRAFHIHEYGDMSDRCTSMGKHYDPSGSHDHGSLHSSERHLGDLGNVPSVNSCIKHEMNVPNMRLESIVGRGVVVHEREDDLGLGQGDAYDESKRTGNAGPRLQCGVIAWTSSLSEQAHHAH